MGVLNRLKDWAKSDQGLRDKGDAARDARRWPVAVDFYAQYLARVPEDAGIWVQLGHAHKESGDLAAAKRAYLRALSIETDNPDTHVQLGHVEKLQGNVNQAVARYRQALDLDPEFPAALEEFKKYDFGIGEAPDKSSAPSTPTEDRLADLDKRLKLLADQFAAVKAIAFEVQKLRRRADDLDEHLAEVGQRIADLASRSDTTRSEIERRVSSLESQSPAVQGRFSALLEHFGTIAACKKDLDRQAALIDELMRRSQPA
jgi:tetratricopeptide (TPR) repeat protein